MQPSTGGMGYVSASGYGVLYGDALDPGLRAISERARSLGATVQVDSLAGWGTRIRARFPYRA
ncbi:MAG: hypothetical protein ACRDN0_07815, partial [Trebonia sp.]